MAFKSKFWTPPPPAPRSAFGGSAFVSAHGDRTFVSDLLESARDPVAAVLLLNRLNATYTAKHFVQAMQRSPDAAREILRSGHFDIGKEGPCALGHAAKLGRKDMFNMLMAYGAIPDVSAQHDDDRVMRWAREFYGIAPRSRAQGLPGVILNQPGPTMPGAAIVSVSPGPSL